MLWIALFGCNGTLVTIHVEETVTTTVEQGTLLEEFIGDIGFSGFLDMDITTSDELRNQGVEPGDIQSAHFEQFDLAATAPVDADLSFLESIALGVEAPDLDPAQFASWSDFPEGEERVFLALDDLDLAPYIVSRSMTITTDVTGHRPPEDTTVEAHFDLAVAVTTKGAVGEITE